MNAETASSSLVPPGPYQRKLARVLDNMGSLYTLEDILEAIAEGRMQSFAVRNSWAITQVVDFPRARELVVIAYVGDLADVEALEEKVFDYAAEVGARLVAAYGRRGWARRPRRGWRLKARTYLFHKEI
jgi:hypothetical protein